MMQLIEGSVGACGHVLALRMKAILVFDSAMLLSMKKLLSCLCLGFPLAVFAEAYPSISDAAFHGDVDAVHVFLSDGASVNEGDSRGWTPLHNAAYAGNMGVPQVLLDAGGDANALTASGMSALQLLAMFSCEEAFKHFAAYADLFERFLAEDEKQGPALGAFCVKVEASKEATASALVHAGAEVNCAYGDALVTPLFLAARRGASGVVSVLLEEGQANTDARSFYEGSYGVSALHVAVKKGHVDAARLLISHGADINAVDEVGKTPLHYAVGRGHFGAVQMLVESGADVQATDLYRQTPHAFAVTLLHSDRPDLFSRECYEPIVAYLTSFEPSE